MGILTIRAEHPSGPTKKVVSPRLQLPSSEKPKSIRRLGAEISLSTDERQIEHTSLSGPTLVVALQIAQIVLLLRPVFTLR